MREIYRDFETMKYAYKTTKDLFLRQSYLDAWEDYTRSLQKSSFLRWDYVILTASNEEQAECFRQQIQYRLDRKLLPDATSYAVLPDPEGKRVGSGGATLGVLRYIAEQENGAKENPFINKRILVIHSGGDSKRVPQYSACGKLFAPVPRELPNGQASTLFDEFMIGMSGIPGRIQEGMLVLSGDVLLLFNPLQIDFQFHGAAAISIKESVETGINHGVFLSDGSGYVDLFLHKQSEKQLRELGAVNEQGRVDLDTGAILLDSDILLALYSLISTNYVVDEKKYQAFVNEKARLSFYGDFLYPLAKSATYEMYYREKTEGIICPELLECRTQLWNALHSFSIKLLCLSPADFIHFGTTKELQTLMTKGVDNYASMEWKHMVMTNVQLDGDRGVHRSLIDKNVMISNGTYIENCIISDCTVIGEDCAISNVDLYGVRIPDHVVLHGLKLRDGNYTARIYDVLDNPKDTLETGAKILGISVLAFLQYWNLDVSDLWDDQEESLWLAKFYPVCDTMDDAVQAALDVYDLVADCLAENNSIHGIENEKRLLRWKNTRRTSLAESFYKADVQSIIQRKQELENNILTARFLDAIHKKKNVYDALQIFGDEGINETIYVLLMKAAEKKDFEEKIRIYYGISCYQKLRKICFDGYNYDYLESRAFETIRNNLLVDAQPFLPNSDCHEVVQNFVHVQLPLRVNWGGGWTDTPPYCNEHGGVVLNAAIKLNGEMPVHVEVKRLNQFVVRFESRDIGAQEETTSIQDIQNCSNPYDPFALHKAALLACGIIPQDKTLDLIDILKKMGGGIQLTTYVINVPKGSGLGTSSILSAACVKALSEFVGYELADNELYNIVLCMEQMMSTGGGWQDQVGGFIPGIKIIRSTPGITQDIQVQQLKLTENTIIDLRNRFVLIYSGQRRLARNLLRDVVGSYIGGKKESVQALHKMKRLAVLMQFELEQGDVDAFAKLLNQHWELSKQLDEGSTNTCIDQIFMSCEDLIDAKFICGAGGGGFLQAILKKGVTKKQLSERLREVFQDSGVDVWDCEFA